VKLLLARLASGAFKSAGALVLVYLGLLLAAVGFKFAAHLLTGIKPEEFRLDKYRSPDPDPSKNFFSVLAYDFESPLDGTRYVPSGMPPYGPYPGAMGKNKGEESSAPGWPWIDDFTCYFDLDASAKDIQKVSQGPGPENTPEAAAHRARLLVASSPWSVCSEAISPWRPFFKMLYAVLSLSESLNPIPFDKALIPNGPTMEVITPIKIARVLAFDSLVSFAGQRTKDKVANTLVALRIGEGFLYRPMGMLSQTAGRACLSIFYPVIWKAVDGGYFSEEDLNKILTQLSGLYLMQSAETAINQDFAFTYSFCSTQMSSLLNPTFRPALPLIKPILTNFYRGLVVFNRYRFQKALGEKAPFLNENETSWTDLRTTRLAISLQNDTKFCEIKLQLCRLDIALRIFQLRTGRLPDFLSQLTPAYFESLPLDPLTGESFKYKKLGPNKFIIYSCWVDGNDDGGKPVETPLVSMKNPSLYYFRDAKGDFVWPQHHPARH